MKQADRFLAFVVTIGLVTSCGQNNPDKRSSDLDFIMSGTGAVGLTGKVKKSQIDLCVSGAPSGTEDSWREKLQKATLSWIEPLRNMTSDPLAKVVNVTFDGSSNCDGFAKINPGVWAVTQISNRPSVTLATTGYFGTFNVTLHEFGHMFGLSDTYQDGKSGNCKPGQPQAVMCNTSFSDLQKDDVAGVQALFKKAFPSDRPGDNEDSETEESGKDGVIRVALEGEKAADTYDILVSFESTTQASSSSQISYCMSDKATCSASGSFWLSATRIANPVGISVNTAFYRTNAPVGLRNGLKITYRFIDGSRRVMQSIAFKTP